MTPMSMVTPLLRLGHVVFNKPISVCLTCRIKSQTGNDSPASTEVANFLAC